MPHGITENELSVLSPSDLLKKVVTDLYFGNGKPALTIRVAGIEDTQDVLQTTLEDHKKWQDRITTLIIGTLLSSIGGLVLVIIEMLRH